MTRYQSTVVPPHGDPSMRPGSSAKHRPGPALVTRRRRTPTGFRLPGFGPLIALLALTACRGSSESEAAWGPRLVASGDFTVGLKLAPLVQRQRLPGERFELLPMGNRSELWLEEHVEFAELRAGPDGSSLEFTRRVRPNASPDGRGVAFELLVDGSPLRYVPSSAVQTGGGSLSPGAWTIERTQVRFCMSTPGLPPTEVLLRSFLNRGRVVGDRLRVRSGETSGDGFLVLPHNPVARQVELPRGGRLCFGSSVQGADGPQPSEALPEGSGLTLEIWFQGQRLAAWAQTASYEGTYSQREVRLPKGRGMLEFRIVGEQALCAILAPRIEPLEGVFDDPRPDVVLISLDTFRADNLAGIRGAFEGVDFAPELDAWAERGLLFEHAYSSASWTLPSHASLFTGLYPPEHQAGHGGRSLNAEAVTLAEVLEAGGYRTFAVTDGGYVSASFGLGQGFSTYCELPGDLERTLEMSASLAHSADGRPRFAFIHTYKVHEPYQPGSEALQRIAGSDPGFLEDLARRVQVGLEALAEVPDREARRADPSLALPEAIYAACRAFETLYRAEVRELSEWLPRLFASLRAEGFDEHDYWLLVSDHGEAFGEQNTIGHGNGVWESQIHVPLIVSGPGIQAGVASRPTSLVELAPWLIERLRLPLPAAMHAADILGPPLPQLLAYSGRNGAEPERAAACITWPVKTIRIESNDEQARSLRAWLANLVADPLENRLTAFDLTTPGPWQIPGFEGAGPDWFPRDPLAVLEATGSLESDEELLERLKSLGYAN